MDPSRKISWLISARLFQRLIFEVSEDTAMTFQNLGPAYGACTEHQEGIWRVDLWKANHLLLTDAGLVPEHIETTTSCVFDQADKFFSYRRDGGHTGAHGCLCSFVKPMNKFLNMTSFYRANYIIKKCNVL